MGRRDKAVESKIKKCWFGNSVQGEQLIRVHRKREKSIKQSKNKSNTAENASEILLLFIVIANISDWGIIYEKCFSICMHYVRMTESLVC